MTIAIVTILLGALALAGGLQELVSQGIFNSRLIPLLGGTLGAVSGALLLGAGVALLRRSPRAAELTRAAAITAIPIYVLIGQLVWGLAGWSVTLLGLAWPALLLVLTAQSRQGGRMIRA
ncbi:MAG TPA: hypothetical protein VJ826_03130 [Candidatus Polarisedimenticolaceae bacterium]|nr:hypothetical protein [Candidatus Polarisedimenticolaceae bacterium]